MSRINRRLERTDLMVLQVLRRCALAAQPEYHAHAAALERAASLAVLAMLCAAIAVLVWG